MRLKLRLFRCGRCGKSYASPLGHQCVSRLGRKAGRTTFRPGAAAVCPRCRKPYGNPLTHVCKVRTDFKRKSAKARKDAAAARRKARPEHRYQGCQDEACKRIGCAAYREGRESGYEQGFAAGAAAAAG